MKIGDRLHVPSECVGRRAFRRFHAYGNHYYAAFLIDPDGHRIEAVCKSVE